MDIYRQRIDEVMEGDGTIDEKWDSIEKLYVIKPVRLEWYLAKAKLFWKRGCVHEAYSLLERNYLDDYRYDGIISVELFFKSMEQTWSDDAIVQFRDYIVARLSGEKDYIKKVNEELCRQERQYIERGGSLKLLASYYLIVGKWNTYYLSWLYEEIIGQKSIAEREWISNFPNMGYIRERINKKGKIIICVDKESVINEAFILGRCFSEMGSPVYILTPTEKIEIDAPIQLQDTVSISLDNISEQYGIILIPVIELILEGKSLGNNCADIVNQLCGDDTLLFLASSSKFEELSRTQALKNKIDNLCGYQEKFRKDYFSFGWAGSYLSYIQQLYNMDVREALYRQPTCRFSIVIPARNSAVILQHTLKTCLNQRWQGDYEIVISDNSTEGNNEVYQFCQTLQDERIKYYKTPRDLRLNRSFEYAFLQTRGEYVLSIGSDDALLPWTLEVWDQVIKDYPEEEIFIWDRGFYAWPGFNGGQQHQFTVPGKYQKGKYHAEYVEPIQFLSWAMENPSFMYLLPMLYINSGFKRSFMQTLLGDTGRLWDGICQDIYMGVIVSVMKEKIVKINYPLAVAGMSSGSVGALANLPMTDQAKSMTATGRELKENNVGGFSKSQIETLTPELGSDVTSLYNSILRAVNRGLIPRHYLTDVFDWKTWFMNIYQVMRKEDIYFDRKIHQMRFAAMKHGEEFLKWFDETIYKEALKPEILPEVDKTVKTYSEYDDERGMTLDASKYGVYNSYEASLLFERMTGL